MTEAEHSCKIYLYMYSCTVFELYMPVYFFPLKIGTGEIQIYAAMSIDLPYTCTETPHSSMIVY